MSPLFKFLLVTLILGTAGGVWWHSSSGAFTTINLTLTTNPTLETGLVGHWTMDGNDVNWSNGATEIKDRSGSGNHGNAQGSMTVASPAEGVLGQGMSFNGVDDLVLVSDTAAYTFGNGTFDVPFSVCAWQWVASTGVDMPMVNKTGSVLASNTEWSIGFLNTNQAYFRVHSGGTFTNSLLMLSSVSTTDSVGAWVHLCGVYDGTRVKQGLSLYWDGVLSNGVGVTNGTYAAMANTTSDLNFGVIYPGSAQQMYNGGGVDDVRIYNRELSAEEVKRIYELGATTKVAQTLTTNPTLETGLVGHWTMDGNDVIWASTTAEIRDRSGNNNHGNATSSMTMSTSPMAGVLGQGMEFDGIGDAILVGDPASGIFDFGTSNDFSLATWFTTGGSSETQVMIGKYGYGTSPGYFIAVSDAGVLHASLRDGLGVPLSSEEFISVESGGNAVFDNTWHHAVASNDRDGFLRLYLDGVQVGTGDITTITDNTSNAVPLYIGRRQSGISNPLNYMHGALDDVRIYNRALSADEVKRLYELGR